MKHDWQNGTFAKVRSRFSYQYNVTFSKFSFLNSSSKSGERHNISLLTLLVSVFGWGLKIDLEVQHRFIPFCFKVLAALSIEIEIVHVSPITRWSRFYFKYKLISFRKKESHQLVNATDLCSRGNYSYVLMLWTIFTVSSPLQRCSRDYVPYHCFIFFISVCPSQDILVIGNI